MNTNITPREKEVLENKAKAISDMSDFRKGEFLGYARAMLDLKRQRNYIATQEILEKEAG